MLTRIQDIHDIQGAFIRRILHDGSAAPLIGGELTPDQVTAAHAKYLPGRPGAPRPHQRDQRVVMFITYGKWKGICPDCHAGVTTGAGWARAHCFECGAILAAVWPADRAAIEADVLTRPPRDMHWNAPLTIADANKEG